MQFDGRYRTLDDAYDRMVLVAVGGFANDVEGIATGAVRDFDDLLSDCGRRQRVAHE